MDVEMIQLQIQALEIQQKINQRHYEKNKLSILTKIDELKRMLSEGK
jgi:hypothetical protein